MVAAAAVRNMLEMMVQAFGMMCIMQWPSPLR
jgi:hypothetical protein